MIKAPVSAIYISGKRCALLMELATSGFADVLIPRSRREIIHSRVMVSPWRRLSRHCWFPLPVSVHPVPQFPHPPSTSVVISAVPGAMNPSTLLMEGMSDSQDFDRNSRPRGPFRPKAANKGTSNYQLRQFAEATLGNGSLRKVVKLPEGEDLNEWLAVNGCVHCLRTLLRNKTQDADDSAHAQWSISITKSTCSTDPLRNSVHRSRVPR